MGELRQAALWAPVSYNETLKIPGTTIALIFSPTSTGNEIPRHKRVESRFVGRAAAGVLLAAAKKTRTGGPAIYFLPIRPLRGAVSDISASEHACLI